MAVSEQVRGATAASLAQGEVGRTDVSGWLLRGVVSLVLIAGMAQPVFAGSYLSGDFAGLVRHGFGADLVSYLAGLQVVIAIVVWIRARRVWPFVSSMLLLAAVAAQYGSGEGGALWLHIPLGVLIVAATMVMFLVCWLGPIPRRSRQPRVATEPE